MASPTLVANWPTRGEVSYASTSTVDTLQKSWIFNLKAGLMDQITSGTLVGSRDVTSIWTCEGSSNSLTAGMDGVDRWGSTYNATNLVSANAGTAHSWIVLKSHSTFGNGATMYVLLSLGIATSGNWVGTFSRNPYTGGSITARPTSVNETGIGIATAGNATPCMANDGTTGVSYFSSISVAPGGEFWYYTNRVATGVFNSVLGLFDMRDISAGDTFPGAALYNATGSTGRGAGLMTNIATVSAGFNIRNYNGTTRMGGGGLTQYTFGSTAFAGSGGVIKDSLLNKWPTLPLFAYGNDALTGGWRGRIPDAWVLPPVTVGAGYPINSPRTQTVVGDLLLPGAVAPSL